MKQHDVKNWPKDIENYYGLLLFAQAWEEMLFDFTLDSYKPRRFNTLGLCSELIDAYELYERKIIGVNSITPIVEELKYSLNKDTEVKTILGDSLERIISEFKQWDPKKPKKLIVYTASLVMQTTEELVQERLGEQIKARVKQPTQKAVLIEYASKLLTELLRKGYSPTYIYRKVQDFFFSSNSITTVDAINEFLEQFTGDDKQYEVIFYLSKKMRALLKSTKDEYLRQQETLQSRLETDSPERDFISKLKPTQTFIVAPEIEARDPYSARREAEYRLVFASTLTIFLTHDIRVNPSHDALVYEGNPYENAYIIKPTLSATMKSADVLPARFEEAFNNTIRPIVAEDVDANTTQRLISSLRAHAAGIHARASENQFVNLWTAYEAIMEVAPNQGTIREILRKSLPVLCNKYFLKLVSELRDDTKRCIPSTFNEVLSNRAATENEMGFFVRLLSTEKNSDLRKQLYSACSANPLLRYRISYFHDNVLHSAADALKILKEHEQRISWQLQRLYRARNSIVHEGSGNDYIDLLTENLHDYFDHIFRQIVRQISEQPHYGSLEKVFFDQDVQYQSYKKSLKNCKADIQPQELAELVVFGSSQLSNQ